MKLLSRLPLRALLTLPYVALVLGTAIVIGVLSYAAGRDAVDNLSGQLLTETVHRIEQAVEGHVSGSAAVLEVAFPKGIPAPESISGELPALRERFWLATSVHRDPNNYAYYGDRDGRFIGLWRSSESDAELRLRPTGAGPRDIYHYSGIAGELGRPDVETRIFEPRDRPWYKAGAASALQTWTSIYIDFKLQELVATRARRVTDRNGAFKGVVATDISLRQVTSFLQRLALSSNGVAMVLEKDGNLIGVSRGEHIKKQPAGTNVRLNAADSADPLVKATYAAVRGLADTAADARPHTTVFSAPDGSPVPGAPRHRVDAWASYRFDPAARAGWGVGAGVHARSHADGLLTDGQTVFRNPGQYSLDANVFYRAPRWSVTLGVRNLLGRALRADDFDDSFVPLVERRSVLLSGSYDF